MHKSKRIGYGNMERSLDRGDGSNSSVALMDQASNLQWTSEMDNMLLDCLVEEQHKGNRQDGTFTTTAYANVVTTLREHFGPIIQKNHIKNQLKTIKAKFNDSNDLFYGLSGFAWNSATKMFEATSEVWEQLIKEKPKARKWLRTPIANFDKLYELFAEDRATCDHAFSAKEKCKQWQTETCAFFDLNNCGDPMTMSPVDFLADDIGHCSANPTAFSPDPTPSANSIGSSSKGTKRKAAVMEMLENQYERMNMGMETIAKALEKNNEFAENVSRVLEKGNDIAEDGNRIFERSLYIMETSRPHVYLERDIFAALQGMDLPPNILRTAYTFLTNNQLAARQFFGVPDEFRLEFLMELINVP